MTWKICSSLSQQKGVRTESLITFAYIVSGASNAVPVDDR